MLNLVLRPKTRGASHLVVDDRGSDVTVVSFAGAAVLFAGLPAFEFRRQLRSQGDTYNLVFFRDFHRRLYHLRPDGRPGGLAYFEDELRRTLDALGARHNVLLGASGGGGAALYYGVRCRAEQVIAFNPVYDLRHHGRLRNIAASLADLRALRAEPMAYAEAAFISVLCAMARPYLYLRFRKHGGWWDVDAALRGADAMPHTTVFYGESCRADARQARLLAQLPRVHACPLPTRHHNCARILQRQAQLGRLISETIHAGLAARQARSRQECCAGRAG